MELLSASQDSLIEEAIDLWSTYAETYRTTIYRYLFLISWKAEACSGNKKIRVGHWLEKMRPSDIRYMIYTTRYELECNHAYRTVSARIVELAYEMAHFGEKGHAYGVMDTELRTAGPFMNGRRPRHANSQQ